MRDAERERARLVGRLRAHGIRDEDVLQAIGRVPRELFVPPEERSLAYEDEPLEIGCGQTISQPTIVALMCELAHVRPGARVLDVGTGSGYQAAVLAELGALVEGIEILPELAEAAERALAEAGYAHRVTVHLGDGSLGLPERAPFEAILVAAAAPRPPRALVEQLVPGGRLVVPVGSRAGQELEVLVATPAGAEVTRSVPCRFVPLRGAGGFDAEATATERARVRVTGFVQGVYFRAQTQERARSLGVAGWVRNAPDGSVEAVFEGAADAVETMVEWSRHGPPDARVERVEVAREQPLGERGFRVLV